ncbi:Baculoviral IAP repeat-containing protein 6 [Mycena kentingensis (nom. inval.)]|nr:Baculoviral IAP repeat-containing protein 6 [Mycena kentingensis (nom. inval.)]
MRLDALLPRQDDGCVKCGATPTCNCAANQSCFLRNRDCHTCASVSCVSNDATSSSSKSGPSKGALAGAVIGVLIFLALAVCAFLWYRRRNAARKTVAYDVKPDIPASAETVLNRPDPTEKPATPIQPEPNHVVRVFSSSNMTIDLDPQSQNSPLHTPSRHSVQSNPFSDTHSIQTAGTESTNVIPIALVSPEHRSLADTASTGPLRPPRSPDLNLEHANVSLDSVRPNNNNLYAPSQISGISGVSSRHSYMSGASFASDFLNEAPMIITPVKGNVRVVKAEVINAGSLSPVTSEGPRASRPPVTSPLASKSFGPADVVNEEEEPATDPFRDRPSSPASVTTFGRGSGNRESTDWTPDGPNLPWARSGDDRPTSLSTQAGSVIDIGNATRVNVGLLTPATSGGFPRSPYRTTMGRLVTPNTSNQDASLEEQQQRALDHAQARAQAQGGHALRRISDSSVMSAAADSILESFPFVPPSPISDRPMRSPPVSPLAQQSFTVPAKKDKIEESDSELPAPPSRRMLGMSTASQLSTASSGLGSFPFQIDSGNNHDSHPATPFNGRQRASLDTLALTSDLSSYPLGFDRDSVAGATPAQAKAALAKYKDVMQAAERIFDGQFDHVVEDDDGDVPMLAAQPAKRSARPMTPDDEEEDAPIDNGSDDDVEDDGDDDEYIDYDSDDGVAAEPASKADADPYARIFFSKDHREEVIEVEEEPETATLSVPLGGIEQVKLLPQGEWMKGCPPPTGGEQGFLFTQYTQLSEGKCACPHGCGASVPRAKSDFFPIFAEFSSYIKHLQGIIQKTCSRCQSDFCFACGEPITEKVQRPGAAAPGDPLFHCADIQGVIIGMGLYMLLDQMVQSQAAASSDPKTRNSNNKRRKTGKLLSKDADDDDDEPYFNVAGSTGKRAKGGIGYAGDLKEDNTGQLEALATQAGHDKVLGNLLTQLGVYLPSLHRDGTHPSDFLPHPTTLAHLRRRFNYLCAALLRNDSLADMSDRSVLYFQLLQWLETISQHEGLASLMGQPIMTVASVKSTTRKSPNNKPIRERTVIYEGSSGPRELLEAIVIQAYAALKALEGNKAPELPPEELTEEQKRMTVDVKGKGKEEATTQFADENMKLLSFCQRIINTANAIDRSLRETKGNAFVERLHASLPKVVTSSSADESALVDPGTTQESAIKAYTSWANRVRFEYCDLTIPTTTTAGEESQVPHYKSYFNNEIRMLALSDLPKRSLAIAKELSILTNNLPIAWDSSIFLRIDETRVDVLKALITGPESTPYYNGCYCFDVFLGPSYNQMPPNVKYMTTNGGKFRFNPNLYADGKVCLSLLGTWAGPGWVAGRSTLLQVLISIQSMILCEEPYLNEPGWAQSGGSPQSHAYSANVRRMVVKTAMLQNLQHPPEPWADIIRTHFRLKAASISEQLDKWLALDDGKPTMGDGAGIDGVRTAGSSTNGFAADVAEMKKLLKELQTKK